MSLLSLLAPKIRWFFPSTLLVLMASCSQNTAEISFESAWVRTPLPSKTTTSAYVQLKNRTTDPITLTSAESTTIGAIEFHKSVLEDGMHRMIKLDTLEIPAKDTLKLEPGSFHLMLFRLKEVDDNKHLIKFHSESGPVYQATFEVHDEEPK